LVAGLAFQKRGAHSLSNYKLRPARREIEGLKEMFVRKSGKEDVVGFDVCFSPAEAMLLGDRRRMRDQSMVVMLLVGGRQIIILTPTWSHESKSSRGGGRTVRKKRCTSKGGGPDLFWKSLLRRRIWPIGKNPEKPRPGLGEVRGKIRRSQRGGRIATTFSLHGGGWKGPQHPSAIIIRRQGFKRLAALVLSKGVSLDLYGNFLTANEKRSRRIKGALINNLLRERVVVKLKRALWFLMGLQSCAGKAC